MREALDDLLSTARAVVPADAAALWLWDAASGHLTLAAYQGMPADELVREIVPAEGTAERQALATGYLQMELPGDPRPGSLRVRLGPAGRPVGLLHLRTRSVAALDDAARARACAIAALGSRLLEASQKVASLEQTEAAQAQFIHVATHELRSPVAVAQTLVRNVLKGYVGAITEKQHHVFSRISAQLDHLESLINDLLDLAASRSPAAERVEPVALNGSIGRAVLLWQPRAEEKGIALNYRACRDEIVVLATEDGLDRIMVNLVGNAVKYTPTGGQVTVGLCQSGDEVVVTVADTGIGIPPEALPNLFQEFYRAPNARAANITGTGLGLAIVKRLVELYHGQIAVESEVGRGTTFTITFPAYRGAH
ncbi:MAG: HAMP domain-containing histidine kinase [Anaerolineae bacterium]|nr:HAMP domain-containing histidine kinase [Anaerolineae bacterium]